MKKKVSGLLLVVSLGIAGTTAFANDMDTVIKQDVEVTQDVESRASDTIEMKYRYHNGHLQCRRWNATKGRWEDPYWKNVT
mgnify:FL=1